MLASKDAFDRGAVALAALFGGRGQLTNSNRSFGQGAAGFGRYFGASYGDWLIGDYMTEGVFPTLLHQDPRYFRRSTGSGWSRLGYAMGQIFWTHRDSGGTQFKFFGSAREFKLGSHFERLLQGQQCLTISNSQARMGCASLAPAGIVADLLSLKGEPSLLESGIPRSRINRAPSACSSTQDPPIW